MQGVKGFKVFIYMLISAALIYGAAAINWALGGSLQMTPVQFYETVGIMGVVIYSVAFFLSANYIFIGFRGLSLKSGKVWLNVLEYSYRILFLLLAVASVVFLGFKVNGLWEIIKGAKLVEYLAAFLFAFGILIAFSLEISEFVVYLKNRPKKSGKAVTVEKAKKNAKVAADKKKKEAKEEKKEDKVDTIRIEKSEAKSNSTQPAVFNFGKKK